MSNYIFLTENFAEETKYFAIPEDRIETLLYHECYAEYGEKVGHAWAEDYSLDNEFCTAKEDCEEAVKEKFGLESVIIYDGIVYSFDGIDADDYHGDFLSDDIEGADEHNATLQKIIDINAFIHAWRKQNEVFTEVRGFNYWDGHNHKSIITMSPVGEPSHLVVNDDKLTDELNDAIENKVFVNEGFGKKLYRSGKWVIEDNYCEGVWASYFIEEVEEEQD